MNKKADIVRVYLPPDANTLLSVADHCLRSRNYVNVIVAGKQPELQWLDMDAAIAHCTNGIGIWSWASNDQGVEPDVVMACAGDVPTLETLAAVRSSATAFSRSQNSCGECCGPDDAAAAERTSPRPFRPRLRLASLLPINPSSSLITVIPGSFTGSAIAGMVTTTSMCAAIKKKALPRLLLI